MILDQDIRFAARLLMKNRGFTAAAVMALALGIGVNNTFFALVNAICLRGPLQDSSGLVHLGTRSSTGTVAGFSYADFADARAASRTLTSMAAYANVPVALSDDGRAAERVTAAYVSANAFTIADGVPALGRAFTSEDDEVGALPAAILADTVWSSRYGSDSALIGRTVRINGRHVTVVGVMREGFRFPNEAGIWLPLASMPGVTTSPRTVRTLGVFGRLAEGASLTHARSELADIAARLAASTPATNTGITATVVPFNEQFTPRITDPTWLAFMAAGALVLLIACANVANLLLARALRRAAEIALRMSLGATRRRVMRQLLMESALLAALGGGAGLALSFAGIQLLNGWMPENYLPSWMRPSIDARVLAMLTAVCLGTVFVFGLVPALFISRVDTRQVLNERAADSGSGYRARRGMTAFLTAEIALTFVLLAALVLDVRTFREAERNERAFDTTGILTASLALPAENYRTPAQRTAFHDRLLAQVEGAGAQTVSLASTLPFGPAAPRPLTIEGRTTIAGEPLPSVLMVGISRRYFDALGVKPVAGRAFSDDDGKPGQDTAIVNARFAQLHFPDGDVIGRRIQLPAVTAAGSAPWLTIVGVSPTIRQGPNPPGPVVYVPIRWIAPASIAIIMRSRPDRQATAPFLRDEVRRLDPDLPLFRVIGMEQVLTEAGFTGRFASALIRTIASIALVLAVVGFYAVTAYVVGQRTREIGVRMALGAQARTVRWIVLRRALFQLTFGLLVGMAATLAWDRLFGGQRSGASMSDVVSIAGVAAVLISVGVAASLVPARRATRLDPVAALRTD